MSSAHGFSSAEYAAEFQKFVSKSETSFLFLRDVPDLVQKYAKGNMALDYGCGVGQSTGVLKTLGFTVDGVDINEHMITLAQRALPDVNFQLLREGKIPAKNGRYDLAFCCWVLSEIGPKAEVVAALSEIARVLKQPDGILVAIVPTEAKFTTKDWINVNEDFDENKNLKSGDQTKQQMKGSNFYWSDYFWTEQDYRDMLEEAGFDVVLIHHPLGRDDDGIAWVNETEKASSAVYVAKKKTQGKTENQNNEPKKPAKTSAF